MKGLGLCGLVLVMVAVGAAAQSNDALGAQIKEGQELHESALALVQLERGRSRQPLCPDAMNTVDINSCYASEAKVTDGNELKFVRLLGMLLRLGSEGAPKRLPFDEAETTWGKYREQACTAAGSQYAGGTIRPSIEMGCKLTVTRHHMEELWELYQDLGTR